MKVSELTGVQLDWAVAVAEGGTGLWYDTCATWWIKIDGADRALSKGWSASQRFCPSTEWACGGPIIHRERISLLAQAGRHSAGLWYASRHASDPSTVGPDPLIAAMRCYVAHKLGDDVEVPKGLL
jgi:hypothetical protein